jgi:hypothetical protein
MNMKKIKNKIIVLMLIISSTMNAQTSININVSSPPLWGPSGYSSIRYYYLPDMEMYYDVNDEMFIYFHNGVWLRRAYLPHRYRHYDLYEGHKVVINNYYGEKPYYNFNDYKVKYPKGFKKGHPQQTNGRNPKNSKNAGDGHQKNPSNHSNKQQKSRSPSHQQHLPKNKQHGGGKKK